MKIETQTKETITFDIEGANGTAFIENNEVKSVTITLGSNQEINQVRIKDERFLRDVCKVIEDLLRHVDNKRNGGRKTANSWAPKLPEDQRNLDKIIQELSKPGIVGLKKDER